jgi:hypothetical protein
MNDDHEMTKIRLILDCAQSFRPHPHLFSGGSGGRIFSRFFTLNIMCYQWRRERVRVGAPPFAF